MSKVYVISTGGTISMQNASENADDYNFEKEILRILPEKNYPKAIFNFDETPIDSSEMKINNWNRIAQIIYDNYEDYDGFVVLHGTDTMAFTGSVLSFIFENLRKPIVITGSQTPLSEPINDARENLINAIYIAGTYQINEVSIYFNRSLYRANRTTKFSTISYDAYQCPNYPLLAKMESSISIPPENLDTQYPVDKKLELTLLEPFDIRQITLMPCTQAKGLAQMMKGADAVIIGTFGDGNIPMLDSSFLDAIKEAHDDGTIVINRSQCLHSNTQVEKYSDKNAMLSAGFIPASDQSTETLMSKLLYCFSKKYSQPKTEMLLQTNMRGELTSPKGTQPIPHYKTAFFGTNKSPPKLDNSTENITIPAYQTSQVGGVLC